MRVQAGVALAVVFCPAVASAFAVPPRLPCPRRASMAAAAGGGPVGPLDRGVQHVGDKPYTSIDAASDVDVIGRDAAVDPYIGTALGTVREAYCAANSNLPSAEVADVLAWVESETRLRLSKDYMLTGSLVPLCAQGTQNCGYTLPGTRMPRSSRVFECVSV